MEAGVPQGSVLGPLLFIIYFNDIADTKGKNELALFADDVCSWVISKSLKVIRIRLQKQLDEIEEWMSKWRMKLSVTKTNYTIFNKPGLFKTKQIDLTYSNQQIKAEKNPKFLGITLDPGMRLHKYAQSIKERGQRRINMLRRIKGKKWGASSKLIFITYKVLIRSIIDYVPFATLMMANNNQTILERIQRKAIRVAIYWPIHTSAKEMYARTDLEPIIDRAYQMTDKYINKAITTNNIAKETIDNYKIATEHKEGAFCKTIPRRTILGILKDNQTLKCNQYLASTTT
jgi:hypothetical protein